MAIIDGDLNIAKGEATFFVNGVPAASMRRVVLESASMDGIHLSGIGDNFKLQEWWLMTPLTTPAPSGERKI
jgi:hypothetical protein